MWTSNTSYKNIDNYIIIKNIQMIFPLNVCAVTSVVIWRAMLNALNTSNFSTWLQFSSDGSVQNSEMYLYMLDKNDKVWAITLTNEFRGAVDIYRLDSHSVTLKPYAGRHAEVRREYRRHWPQRLTNKAVLTVLAPRQVLPCC